MKAVLFDLDGTLTDSGPIIRRTLRTVMLEKAGVDRPESSYTRYIGPPLTDSFADMGVAPEQIDDYIRDYRGRYDEILDTTPVFDGVRELLAAVKDAGIRSAIATSKWESVAQNVCDCSGITPLVDAVCGSFPDSRHSKADVVAAAVNQLYECHYLDQPAQRGFERDDVIMVGDRIYDIEGAGQYGIKTILVTWGEGTEDEEKRAWKVVSTPAELLELLLSQR